MNDLRRISFLLLLGWALGLMGLAGAATSAAAATAAPASAGAKSLLPLAAQWNTPKTNAPGVTAKYFKSPQAKAGGQSDVIEVSKESPVGFYIQDQLVKPVTPGDIYHFSCWVKAEGIAGGAGAYAAMSTCDVNDPGKKFSSTDSTRVTGSQDWIFVDCVLMVPEGANGLQLFELMNGTGRASFSNAELELVSKNTPLDHKTVQVSLSGKLLRDDFRGFGFEDDPFFFTSFNYRNGIDDADVALRERRIQELKPALVRVFLFWDAFNPGHNLRNITYRTELMDSFYRTLDVYQKMNVPVNVVGAYWGWENQNFPFTEKNVEKGAEVYARVIKHLVKEKGYSCIKFVTIGNEPDLFWEEWTATFDTFVKTAKLLRANLDKQGLRDLPLVGCDTSENFNWFKNTVKQADACFGQYSIHKYLNVTQYPLIGYHLSRAAQFVGENAAPLKKNGKESVSKPLFLWEYGLQGDAPSATINDEMKGYHYGLLSAYVCMSLMNHGFSGASIWCLHSMFYVHHIADKMEYGLWEFKDQNWKIRPVYYSFGLFTTLYKAGMNPVAVTQEPQSNQFASAALTDARGNKMIYLLNMSNNKVDVSLRNVPGKTYQIYEYAEGRLPGAKDPGYEKVASLKTDRTWTPSQGAISVSPQTFIVLK